MRINIKTKLALVLVTLIITSVTITGVISYNKTKEMLISQINTSAFKSVDDANTFFISTFLHNYANIVDLWAEDSSLTNYYKNNGDFNNALKEWKGLIYSTPDIKTIYFGNKEGKLKLFPSEKLPQNFDARIRPWYINALQNDGKTSWSKPYVDVDASKGLVITASKTVKDRKGNLVGVMGLDIKLNRVADIVNKMKIGSKGYVMIIDNNGTVISHRDKSQLGKVISKKQWVKDILKSHKKSGSTFYKLDGQESAVSYVSIPDTEWKLVGVMPTDLSAMIAPIRNRTILVIIISIIFASLIGYIFTKVIFDRMNSILSKVSQKINTGDLTGNIDVNSNDEIGDITKSFNYILDIQRNILRNVSVTANKIGRLSLELNQTSSDISGSTKNQFTLISSLSNGMQEMSKAIEDVTYSISDMAKNMDNINNSTKDLSGTSQEVAQNAEDTTVTISDVTSALEQMDAAIETVAHNSVNVNQKALETVKVAESGKKIVDSTINEMLNINSAMNQLSAVINELGKSALEIGDIVEVIDDIAEQTNLLSLNAAIEAARAGEHGKGFAVVANAVGSLAQKSSEATKDIAKLIKEIQQTVVNASNTTKNGVQKVEYGVELVKNTGKSFEEIYNSINETTKLVSENSESIVEQSKSSKFMMDSIVKLNELSSNVSSSVEEQTVGFGEIAIEVDKINGLTQSVASATEEQSAASESIAASTEKVNEMSGDIALRSENILETANSLSEESERLLKIISNFKLEE